MNESGPSLSKFPQWFVEPEFLAETGLKQCIDVNIHDMNAKIVVLNLDRILSKTENPIPWDSASDTPPNSLWLQVLYDYLTDQGSLGFKPDADALKKLPIVPDQFGRLWQPGLPDTPLWAEGNTDTSLVQALSALRIPIVSASHELLAAISRFNATFPDVYIL